jgi:2,3-dihydroxybenzoate decarboxylase
MKKIAIEEHWGNQEMAQLKTQWTTRSRIPQWNNPAATTHIASRYPDFEKYRIPLMDESGVTMQVLSIGSPSIQGCEDVAAAIDVAKRTNDAQAEIIRKHPDRFAGFASLPMQDPGAAADELERTVRQLGFKGAMIQGHTNWEYLDEQKFWVLWERAEALDVPVYLHVNEPSMEGRGIYKGHPELNGPGWSWVVETATHALRIVGAGVFDAFPRATLILGHLGEALPFLLGRLDEGYAMSLRAKELKKPFSQYIRENILITTSGRYRPEALACCVQALGADRILFAGDYPWVAIKDSVEQVESTPIPTADKEKIFHLNAERWLKL